jgi:hypothetical protein
VDKVLWLNTSADDDALTDGVLHRLQRWFKTTVEELLNNCKTVDEMLPLYIMKMESLEAEGFDSRAISVGVETLWLLGEPITKHPHLGNVLYAYN